MPHRSSANGKSWSREELLLAMNLYCRIPFGHQHSRTPEVIELARALGRSPGSVAMKLNNFTSLDPKEAARGIRGLTGVSQLDQQVWDEFHTNWEELAEESEELWRRKVGAQVGEIPSAQPIDLRQKARKNRVIEITTPQKEPIGPMEGERIVRIRLAQEFFRRTVLTAYGVRCCISSIPIPELLIASHILPWSRFPEHRINPRNGLCLSRLHDAAFDQGLITLDEQNRLVLSHNLRDYLPNDSLYQNFMAFEGHRIHLPEKFLPEPEFLRHHREQIFRG